MNWSSFAVGLALGLVPLPGKAANDVAADAATNRVALDWVLGEVLAENASLKAARANWEAMKQRVPQARAWEDARAGFDTVAGRFVSIPPNGMPDQMFSVEETLPLSGALAVAGLLASPFAKQTTGCRFPAGTLATLVPRAVMTR
jgi:hypothetical protein